MVIHHAVDRDGEYGQLPEEVGLVPLSLAEGRRMTSCISGHGSGRGASTITGE